MHFVVDTAQRARDTRDMLQERASGYVERSENYGYRHPNVPDHGNPAADTVGVSYR